MREKAVLIGQPHLLAEERRRGCGRLAGPSVKLGHAEAKERRHKWAGAGKSGQHREQNRPWRWATEVRRKSGPRERSRPAGAKNQGGRNKRNSFFIFKPNSNMNQIKLEYGLKYIFKFK